jgi:hypothetical protein
MRNSAKVTRYWHTKMSSGVDICQINRRIYYSLDIPHFVASVMFCFFLKLTNVNITDTLKCGR